MLDFLGGIRGVFRTSAIVRSPSSDAFFSRLGCVGPRFFFFFLRLEDHRTWGGPALARVEDAQAHQELGLGLGNPKPASDYMASRYGSAPPPNVQS